MDAEGIRLSSNFVVDDIIRHKERKTVAYRVCQTYDDGVAAYRSDLRGQKHGLVRRNRSRRLTAADLEHYEKVGHDYSHFVVDAIVQAPKGTLYVVLERGEDSFRVQQCRRDGTLFNGRQPRRWSYEDIQRCTVVGKKTIMPARFAVGDVIIGPYKKDRVQVVDVREGHLAVAAMDATGAMSPNTAHAWIDPYEQYGYELVEPAQICGDPLANRAVLRAIRVLEATFEFAARQFRKLQEHANLKMDD
jgi:hypothetical protein